MKTKTKTIEILDSARYVDEIQTLEQTSHSFNVNLRKLASHNLPLSLDFFKKVFDTDSLQTFLDAELQKAVSGMFVPRAVISGLKMEYRTVVQDCSKELTFCASIANDPDYVMIESPISIDITETKKKIENRCVVRLDASKIEEGGRLLLNLEKALSEFVSQSQKGGFSLPGSIAFWNDGGTVGTLTWSNLIQMLLDRPNMTEEEAEQFSERCYRSNCQISNEQ